MHISRDARPRLRAFSIRQANEVAGAHQWGIAGSPVLAGRILVVATLDGSLYGFPLD